MGRQLTPRLTKTLEKLLNTTTGMPCPASVTTWAASTLAKVTPVVHSSVLKSLTPSPTTSTQSYAVSSHGVKDAPDRANQVSTLESPSLPTGSTTQSRIMLSTLQWAAHVPK